PVGLDVGIDLIAHLLQPGFTRGGQVMVVRAHRMLRSFALVPIECPSQPSPRLSSVGMRPGALVSRVETETDGQERVTPKRSLGRGMSRYVCPIRPITGG